MKKFKIVVGFFAFMGLAVLNFTQSESSFVSKSQASSSSGSSGGFWSSVESYWDSKTHRCEEEDCHLNLGLWTWDGKYEKCVDGNKVAHCWECKSCDAGD